MTQNAIAPRMEVQGFFKLEAVNEATGERRVLADWFPNLILNQGLNRLGSGNIWSNIEVGTGSTAPAVTDSGLVSRVATSSSTQSNTDAYVAGPPDYVRTLIVIRFAAGAAAGNLSEVGIGWSSAPGNLFARSLIKDGSGNPTTITVLASEALDVSYELRTYPPASDVTGTINISGTSYDYVIRPSNVSSNFYWKSLTTKPDIGAGGSYAQSYAMSGGLSARTGQPSGSTVGTATGYSTNAYANNSYKLSGTVTWGLNDGNASFKSVTVSFGSYAYWQIEFTPALPKTNTKVLTLGFEMTWARRP